MIDIELDIEPIDVDVGFEESLNIDLELDIGTQIGTGGFPYLGPYDVVPMIDEQKLNTKNKSMEDDVTVFAIPYSSVSNPEGGETVNIAFV